MTRFGSDKPDLRFAMELVDVTPLFAGGEFQAFAQVVAGGGAVPVAATVLGRLRVDLARRFNLIPMDRDVFSWVIDFPLVEWNPDEKRWDAVHHPFTAPRDEDLPLLESDPGRARAKAYDLVLNGQEAAGGSIRIHQTSVQ